MCVCVCVMIQFQLEIELCKLNDAAATSAEPDKLESALSYHSLRVVLVAFVVVVVVVGAKIF